MDFDFIKEKIKENAVTIGAIVIALCSIAFSVSYVYLNKCEECEVCTVQTKESEVAIEESTSSEKVKVDVKGAVTKPGVYELDTGSTVSDAINLAGGVKKGGTTSNINLSKKVTDEMVVYVFTNAEVKKAESTNAAVCETPKCECETITVTADTAKDASSSSGASSNASGNNAGSTVTNTKVSINTASITELMTLDGIGEAKAKSIIAYREEKGKFEKIEDIKNVSGIGDALYEKIKDNITV